VEWVLTYAVLRIAGVVGRGIRVAGVMRERILGGLWEMRVKGGKSAYGVSIN
jgi:hypothetical protein